MLGKQQKALMGEDLCSVGGSVGRWSCKPKQQWIQRNWNENLRGGQPFT